MPHQALVCSMTLWDHVVFSALTVALSMSTMVLFPNTFCGRCVRGVAVVFLRRRGSDAIAPAAIMLLARLDALDIRRLIR